VGGVGARPSIEAARNRAETFAPRTKQQNTASFEKNKKRKKHRPDLVRVSVCSLWLLFGRVAGLTPGDTLRARSPKCAPASAPRHAHGGGATFMHLWLSGGRRTWATAAISFESSSGVWLRRRPRAPRRGRRNLLLVVAFRWARRVGGAGPSRLSRAKAPRSGVARAPSAGGGAIRSRLWLDLVGRLAPRRRTIRVESGKGAALRRRGAKRAWKGAHSARARRLRARDRGTHLSMGAAAGQGVSLRLFPIRDSIARSRASFRARVPSLGTLGSS